MSKKVFKFLEVLYPFTDNLRKRVYGRELARRLDMSQKTVQNYLNELEGEGLLESRIMGRTKEFVLNRENFLVQKILAATEMRKFYDLLSSSFEVKQIVDDILKVSEGYVIVYGSFAKNDWDEESDFDVLLINRDRRNSIDELKEKYSREIHFMIMSESEFIQGIKIKKPYFKEILKEHVICRGFESITDWRFKYE